ncbi:cupin domain-containing protein [Thiospirochaeta perfilievii]|uniref:Cupin domain-containing protein n=1 Tax=Thiospirochaeta perfilievii TaxID=252967 RepID=A0A5C1QI91_9SPIO|nr:cupin domain-containing protein [Thiospirochaeta perfilievii]QEN05962.1 cupin domain-containing protein [Thiospirochaeta perfilievii]
MNIDRENIIKKLSLTAHPEGGYYSQTYRSPITLNGRDFGLERSEYRALSSSIYFMLNDMEVSHFHRLKSDEVWYFHGGEPLTIVMIDNSGKLSEITLGLDVNKNEYPQVIVPAGTIFGSYIKSGKGVSLVGCMVSFGFDFMDFELFKSKELIKLYPEHSTIIEKLT